ncbi:MAG TPA: hypothetical protein VGC54_10340 [Planctomycetota bacterium]
MFVVLTALSAFGPTATPLPALQAAAKPDEDPYTKGDRTAMERAGIVSFGPFPFGDGHSTRRVDEVLGGERVRWIETAHFRIGSTLPEYRIPRAREQRDKIRAELERLAEKLPEVDPKTRKLDPWLRLHLIALRAEEFYSEFQDWLGVTDADFPDAAPTTIGADFMGLGPYLGQPSKYGILLTAKASSHGRYGVAFLGGTLESAKRHNYSKTGTILLATSTELFDGILSDDTVLHAHLIFNLSQNLLNGYRFYSHDLPLWIPEGLGHWFARRVTEDHNDFTLAPGEDGDLRSEGNWAPRVRARVRHKYFPTAAEMQLWSQPGELSFADHMLLWSRWDFLMSRGKQPFAQFARRSSEPFLDTGGVPAAPEAVRARVEAALQEAWGFDLAGFDAEWSAWVLENYPAK